MNFYTKKKELSEKIYDSLYPLINNDYVLTDLPYHGNIGDLLIWEGEKDFLSRFPYKCLDTSSSYTFTFPKLSSQIIILLSGGGSFGDLWFGAQDFRKKIIEKYPNNRIIMFPQSVWYDNKDLIKEDAEIMAKHKDLYLCARDAKSYEIMKKYFYNNNILLIPDMAFCIEDIKLNPYKNKGYKKMFFKRIDKELDVNVSIPVSDDFDICEWPTIREKNIQLGILYLLLRINNMIKNLRIRLNFYSKIIDLYADKIVRPQFVVKGYKLLYPYNYIITTRLHALILSVLLDKPVDYIDNTTGKLSSFVKTWMSDIIEINPYKYHTK